MAQPDPAFRADVLAGLAAPIPAVPARWLYDRRGSELFEEITRLPEYYPTRTEKALLERYSGEIAALLGKGEAVVEFGSGSSAKTPILLRAVHPAAYVPIDISGDFLRDSAEALQAEFPSLPIHPVEADFMRRLDLPAEIAAAPKLGFFPGSTIGNFVPRTAVDLLRAMKETLGEGARLVIGMDRTKNVDVLRAAYDDAAGVTAKFNLNILRRMNRELGGNFDLASFRHRAFYNAPEHRIEMHLVSLKAQAVTVAGRSFTFAEGETIHTENSYKYTVESFRTLARNAGWRPVETWTDENDHFAVHALKL